MTPIRLFAALAAAALLAGCGVKNVPEFAGERADMYPRTYPGGAVPHDVTPRSIFLEKYPER